MKEENFMAALAGVAERINRNEIDNLLEIDWNRITDGFRECCLKMLLGLIDTKENGYWVLETGVYDYAGVCRFYLGLADEIRILESEEFREYVRKYTGKYVLR